MFVRTRVHFVLLLCFWLPQALGAPALIPAPPQIAAKGYILLDANSGTVLVEHNAAERLEPASLTKMMTSYVADYELAQGNIALTDMTTVSENAWAKNFPGSSLMFLEAGKEVKVEDLLKGVIISSGNDATVALAEHIAGSSSAFTDIMNQHAQLLGMVDTQFRNPHGLPEDGHYTTARDMATLARAIIRDYPEQYGYYAEKSYTYNGIKQTNRNKLLWRDDSVDGLKTGHTSRAGYCLVASAEKEGMRLIVVVMGARSEESRAREAQKLLSYGFRYYNTLKLYDAGQMVQQVKLWAGADPELALVTQGDVYITVPRSKKDAVKARVDVDKYIEAPVDAGQSYGDLVVTMDDDTLMNMPLIASSTVESGGFMHVIWDKGQLFVYRLLEG